MNNNFISPRAKVHKSAYLGNGVVILGPVEIDEGAIVEDYSIIGKPSLSKLIELRANNILLNDYFDYDKIISLPTIIKKNCTIGRNVCIHEGALLHDHVECEDNTRIGRKAEIGSYSRIMYNAIVHHRVYTGKHCRIGGFCCIDTKMEDYVSMFGKTTHAYHSYGTVDQGAPAPLIKSRSTVGLDAIIVGGITIEEEAYIVAGAIVTKDVPSQCVVTGINIHTAAKKWTGDLMNIYLNKWLEFSQTAN